MGEKYVYDDTRDALVIADEELKPKYPRIPCTGKKMRKLWRSIAKVRMKKLGIRRINHKRRLESGKTTSKFAECWRDWCSM